MNGPACLSALDPDLPLRYWLGELDAARTLSFEAHLFACDACTTHLQAVAATAGGIRAAIHAGAVPSIVTPAFLQRLVASGLRVREYSLTAGGSVNCTVAPDDDLVVARLQAPLSDVNRLDLLITGPGGAERMPDIPFDALASEIVYITSIAELRALPKSTTQIQLVAVEPADPTPIGSYTFNHTPWGAD